MTKEITKAIILQEIQDKFSLREFDPAPFLFDEKVTPTYNIEQHLGEWVTSYAQKTITSAPASHIVFAVPEDERWTFNVYNVIFMAAGAYKVTGVFIHRLSGADVYLDMKAGQTVSYAVALPQPIVLNPLESIQIYIDDYTSTANIRVYLNFLRETIR